MKAFVLAAAVGILISTVCVSAETRYLALTTGWMLDVDVTPGHVGEVRRATRLPGYDPGNLVPRMQSVAGGRYLAWQFYLATDRFEPTKTVIALFDRDANAAFAAPTVFRGPVAFLADPLRARLFVLQGSGLSVVDLPSFATRSVPLPFRVADFGLLGYAARADALVVRLQSGDFALVDFARATARVLPIRADRNLQVVVDPYARTLITFEFLTSFTAANPAMTAYDLATGHVIAERRERYNFVGNVDVDVERNRLLLKAAGTLEVPAHFLVLDRATLQTIARVAIDRGGNGPVAFLNTAPAAPYVGLIESNCSSLTLHVIDPERLNPVATVFPWALWAPYVVDYECIFVPRVLTEPARPQNVSVTVTGSTVRLMWEDFSDATTFQVGAGTRPGASDIGLFSVDALHVDVPNVPPGTYYVRVHGRNHLGRSAPSNEIVVRVP